MLHGVRRPADSGVALSNLAYHTESMDRLPVI